MPSSKAIIITLASIALGMWAFAETQAIADESLEMDTCQSTDYTSMEDFVSKTGLRAYDERLGFGILNPFICVITQFLYQLDLHHPAGFLTWGATISQVIPALFAMYVEGGRQGNKGLLLWPTALWVLCQVMGISVVLPLIWVPSYCIWGNKEGGGVSLLRARLVFWVSLSMPVFTVLTFLVYPSDSDAWATCAGILGGPATCLPGLLLVADKAPSTISKEDANKSADILSFAYGMGGVVSLVGWFFLLYTALTHYGLDPTALARDVWFEATPEVRFMTIDGVVLWLGLLAYIGLRDLWRMVEAAAWAAIFGPGAAFSMVMASMELEALSDEKVKVV